jgi:23S rRNA pseudouridine1911/1915/1917 synthase
MQGTIDAPIARHPTKRKEMAIVKGGRHAVTNYQVIEKYGQSAAKLQCELDTGRTHQIRVHCRHIGCPMMGDQTYGLSPKPTLNIIHKGGIISDSETEKTLITLSRQALHARMLRFNHPVTDALMQFEAPLPEDLKTLEEALVSLSK